MKHITLFCLCVLTFLCKSFGQKDFFSADDSKKKKALSYGIETSGILVNTMSQYEMNGYKKNIGWHPRPTVSFFIESNKGSFYRWGASFGIGYDKHDFNFNDFVSEEEKYVSFELLRTQLMLTNTSKVGKYTYFKVGLGGAYNIGLNERIFSPSGGKISSKNNIGNAFSLAVNFALYVKATQNLYIGLAGFGYNDFSKGIKLLDNKVKVSKSALGVAMQYKF